MTAAAIDPLDLPDWAVEPMLAVGFTLEELRRTPIPLTDEEHAAWLAEGEDRQRHANQERRRRILSDINYLIMAAE